VRGDEKADIVVVLVVKDSTTVRMSADKDDDSVMIMMSGLNFAAPAS